MRFLASLHAFVQASLQTRQQRRRALLGGLAALLVWVMFFDSHSLLRRYRWERETRSILTQNERLQAEIDSLDAVIDGGLTDELAEQIARETYGMRRPGETVYRIK